MITLSRALQINNNSESATRRMCDWMEKLEAPQTTEWHRRLSELNSSAGSDAMNWAQYALKQGKPESAALALANVAPEETATPEFQSASGLAAVQTGNVGVAREFFREAARLDPKNDVIRYNLALVQTQSKDAAERGAGETTLKELANAGRAQSFALRTLITQSARSRNFEE